MTRARTHRTATTALLTTLAATTALTTTPAHAVTGSPVPDGAHAFTAHLAIGEGDAARACSGALVEPQWILTSAACFAADPQNPTAVTPGRPALKTTATVGRTDLTGTGGHRSEVVELVPRQGDLVLARLAQPAAGIAPIAVAATPPAAGEELKATGFGRTKTAWVPDRLHAATFTAGAPDATSLPLAAKNGTDTICAGDTGGPVFREKDGKPELIAVSGRSWQGGCYGTPAAETRTGAVASRADGVPLVSRINAGGTLGPGRSLTSVAGRLTMQADGNLVLATASGRTVWSSNTHEAGSFARLGADGNFAVRNPADSANLFQTGTSAAGGHLQLTDRGEVVVRDARGATAWTTAVRARGDVTGDGRADMIDWYDFADGTDGLHTYVGAADGKLGSPVTGFRSTGGQWTYGLLKKVTGDFNGDGHADVALMYNYTATKTVKMWTFLGRADGKFQPPSASWESAPGSFDFARATLHAGDFNGDGRDDVAAWYDHPDGKDTLFTLASTAQGGFTAPVAAWSAPNNWNASMAKVSAGDFNGDGRDDITVLYAYSGGAVKLWNFLATPDGTFSAPVTAWNHDAWGDWSRTHLYTGDFDGDGRDDASFWFDYPDGRDAFFTLAAGPGGAFAAPKTALTSPAGGLTYGSMQLVTGDYNGDGRDDIGAMYGYSDGNVKMFTWTARADATLDPVKTGWTSATANSWDFPLTHFIGRDG